MIGNRRQHDIRVDPDLLLLRQGAGSNRLTQMMMMWDTAAVIGWNVDGRCGKDWLAYGVDLLRAGTLEDACRVDFLAYNMDLKRGILSDGKIWFSMNNY